MIDDAVASVTVTRGRTGRRKKAQLLAGPAVEWRGEVGPLPVPDETSAA